MHARVYCLCVLLLGNLWLDSFISSLLIVGKITRQQIDRVLISVQREKSPTYSYKVKVYDESFKRKYYIRELHNVTEKFRSVLDLEDRIISELELDTLTLSIGYFEGRSHTKKWLITDQDLEYMYAKCARGDISLWCEDDDQENEPPASGKKRKGKSKSDGYTTKRQKREEELDQMVEKLKEKHHELYTVLQYRLWAKTILSGVHDDMNNPPPLPMITGYASKGQKSYTGAIASAAAGAASAVVRVLNDGPAVPTSSCIAATPPPIAVSPNLSVDIRMKNLEQLRYLQQLMNDGILSNEEFLEQKEMILDTLRKI